VSNAFRYDMEAVTTTAYLSGLLERGVPILIYAGTYDAAASWLDNERMTRIVEWSGQQDFVNSPMQVGGEWSQGGRGSVVKFTYFCVYLCRGAYGMSACRVTFIEHSH
jgi:carboxypeptidase C (cathepsin A)